MDDEEETFMGVVTSDSKPPLVIHLSLNSRTIYIRIDAGADVTVISLSLTDYQKC